MKKTFLSLSLIVFSVDFSFAQDITPNAGFEKWDTISAFPNNYLVPEDWDQLNAATNILGKLTCIQTTDTHSGNFAVKLITKEVNTSFGNDTANGIVTTGHLILIPPYGVNGGIPYHLRPDSIYGWYKYIPTPGDSTEIRFELFDVNNVTVGTALFQTAQTINAYTRFSAPVIYSSGGTPDTARWILSSSNGYKALPNSALYVDDIGIIFNTGIPKISPDNFISISPNPAVDFISVKNERHLKGDLLLMDESGKTIRKFRMKKEEEIYNVGDLQNGFYIAEFKNEQDNFFATGKILIQH